MMPVLLQIGPFTIYSYGLALGIGFLVASFLIFRKTRREYLNEEKVFDVVFLSLLGGILGARIFYIIEHFDSFGFSLLNWILINAKPGMSFWGGIGGGLILLLLTVKKHKLSLCQILDIIALPLAVFFSFGELGAFLAGSEIGLPTKLPWGIIYFSTLKRHPISLYILLSTIIIILILLKLESYYLKKKLPSGILFLTYIFLQSVVLFLIAFLREDVVLINNIFKVDQLLYFFLIVVSIILLYKRLGRSFSKDILYLRAKITNRFLKRNEKISG